MPSGVSIRLEAGSAPKVREGPAGFQVPSLWGWGGVYDPWASGGEGGRGTNQPSAATRSSEVPGFFLLPPPVNTLGQRPQQRLRQLSHISLGTHSPVHGVCAQRPAARAEDRHPTSQTARPAAGSRRGIAARSAHAPHGQDFSLQTRAFTLPTRAPPASSHTQDSRPAPGGCGRHGPPRTHGPAAARGRSVNSQARRLPPPVRPPSPPGPAPSSSPAAGGARTVTPARTRAPRAPARSAHTRRAGGWVPPAPPPPRAAAAPPSPSRLRDAAQGAPGAHGAHRAPPPRSCRRGRGRSAPPRTSAVVGGGRRGPERRALGRDASSPSPPPGDCPEAAPREQRRGAGRARPRDPGEEGASSPPPHRGSWRRRPPGLRGNRGAGRPWGPGLLKALSSCLQP